VIEYTKRGERGGNASDLPGIYFFNILMENLFMLVNDINTLFIGNETRFKQIINQIEDSIFYVKINPVKWSASESFHHIYLTKILMFKLINMLSQNIDKCSKTPIKEFSTSETLLNRLKYENMPDTPYPGTEPSNEYSKDQLINMTSEYRVKMNEKFQNCKEYNCSSLKYVHPSFGPLDYYHWFLFEGNHEKNHLIHLEKTFIK
jgi:hypothetical protein